MEIKEMEREKNELIKNTSYCKSNIPLYAKKVSCYHYLIKSSDNLKPFLQLFKEMDVCQYGNVR